MPTKAVLALPLLLTLAAAAPDPVSGRWITEDGAALVAIAPCGPSLCGSVERVLKAPKGSPVTDVKNPDVGKRKRPLVGIDILSNFKPDGSEWKGRIYDPKSGKTYRSVLKRAGPRTLTVKGCIAFLCKTQTWRAAG